MPCGDFYRLDSGIALWYNPYGRIFIPSARIREIFMQGWMIALIVTAAVIAVVAVVAALVSVATWSAVAIFGI